MAEGCEGLSVWKSFSFFVLLLVLGFGRLGIAGRFQWARTSKSRRTRMEGRSEGESGEAAGGAEKFKGAFLGGAEAAFFLGLKIVVAGKVEPAVDDVAEEFLGERNAVFFGVGAGGVHRDADVAGVTEGLVALEGDDVGGARVVEVVGVEFGEGAVGEEGDREFTRRGATALEFGAATPGGAEGGEIGGGESEMGVEVDEGAGQSAAVEAEARVAVREGEFAHWGRSQEGESFSFFVLLLVLGFGNRGVSIREDGNEYENEKEDAKGGQALAGESAVG
jgi:hypothetical protein